jgi:hypothetical protein
MYYSTQKCSYVGRYIVGKILVSFTKHFLSHCVDSFSQATVVHFDKK